MEIKAPKTVADLRIKHFAALSNPVYQTQMDDELACEFIAEFTGLNVDLVKECQPAHLRLVYRHIQTLYASVRLGEPPQEITLAGVEYRRINPHKDGTGWHIDFSKADIKEDPVRLACLFYYPKAAKKYGEKDQNGNLLYPIADRYPVFRDHFPLEVFINASAFFLTRTERSIRLSMESQRMEQRLVSLWGCLTGRTLSTRSPESTTAETGTK